MDKYRTIEARFPKNVGRIETHFEFFGSYKKKKCTHLDRLYYGNHNPFLGSSPVGDDDLIGH